MTIEYHGYKISCGEVKTDQADIDFWCNFKVCKNNARVFLLSFKASGQYFLAQNISASKKEEFVRTKGLNRLYAILDLGKFKEGEKQEHILSTEDSNKKPQETLPDKEIRHEILKGFYNIFKNCPNDYKSQDLPCEGVCDLLNIEQSQYMRNLNYLVETGYLERQSIESPRVFGRQIFIPHLIIYITGKGLELVESERKVGTVIESIFHDTRRFVDSELMQVCPEVFKKLTDTYKDLETGQSQLKWSQVAFACRDILQDFTEAIYKDAYVPPRETRPPRDKTVIKIRHIVKNAAKSETEETFVPALAEYLSEYFEGLNKLVQKHTHGSPDITKEDANRCLIYTYLLYL